jgi:hypothetical protein
MFGHDFGASGAFLFPVYHCQAGDDQDRPSQQLPGYFLVQEDHPKQNPANRE